MEAASETWKEEIDKLQIKIKGLEWKEKQETDENEREKILKEIREETERLLFCQKRLAECESYSD